jgi:uncharacterized protein (TIGR00369 family)
MSERQLPWSDSCFVCGDSNPKGLNAKFTVDAEGRVRLEKVIDHAFEGYGGHVHGGVLTALLDETAAWAVIHSLGRMCTTIQLTVTFRQPVPGGSKVIVVGEVTGRKGRFHLARSEMRDAEGRLLTTAEGRFMAMSEEVHREVVPLLKMPGRRAEPEDI